MLGALFQSHSTAAIIIAIALILSCGFVASRLTRLIKLPDVTAYLLVGILIGPYVLKLIPLEMVTNMGFVTDMALGFISFGVGKYFKREKSTTTLKQIIVITLVEIVFIMSFVVVVMTFVFGFNLAFSFLLGSIACATAPTSTIMTIRQYKAKGNFVNTLLKVIAIDNAISIIMFHICLLFVQKGETPTFLDVLIPVAINIAMVGLGFLLGFLLKKIIDRVTSHDSKLIISLVSILALTGICSAIDIFPLLPCMALGAAYVNAKGDTEVFDLVNKYLPPIVMLFFINSGMRLDISKLSLIGLVGFTYFLIRILGKIFGTYLGGVITKSSRRVKKYVGLALIPQASVSIGMAMLAQRVLNITDGEMLSTIILSSAVMYELIGPITTKIAIILSKSIPPKEIFVTNTEYITPPQTSVETPEVSAGQFACENEKTQNNSKNDSKEVSNADSLKTSDLALDKKEIEADKNIKTKNNKTKNKIN